MDGGLFGRVSAVRAGLRLALAAVFVAATGAQAWAQSGNLLDGLIPAGNASVTGRIVQLVLVLTVLSVAPGLLIMVTSFTRFVIALSFLRSGLGLQSTPANIVLISLSLFMTLYVMQPTFDQAWRDGVRPLLDNKISEDEAYGKIVDPFRKFMLTQVRPKDLQLFVDLAASRAQASGAGQAAPTSPPAATPGAPPGEVDIRVLIPAFITSELNTACEIGFLIFLPFLIIDLVVSSTLMSMGMIMLPPSFISLPFKILLFVLVDGWGLTITQLVQSYNTG